MNDFFSPFTKLQTLEICFVEPDNEQEERSTDLFRGITCLKNLHVLNIGFIQEPDFFSLISLSSLTLLTSLSIEFDSPLDNDDMIIDPGVLPKLLNSLPSLERITIDNGWLYTHKVDESNLFPVNDSLWNKYPKLQAIKGNMFPY